MASFLRGKQSGMQNDLSAAILPHLFTPEEQTRYGINSQISCLAYDPVQSLLAVGTNESKFGRGKIYVFGQGRVQKDIQPGRGVSIKSVHFTANRLVSLDARGEVAIWDLNSGQRVAACPAGAVATMVTDPMLDWALLGNTNGEITAYDLDRERLAPFRIPNFWRARDPRARFANLVSMQLHPRDIGQLLIGYTSGAVIYSFKLNQPVKFFEYTVPPGAPGGNGEAPDTVRRPRLTQALWHPTGTFVLTAHDDGSLVFWDPKDGRVIMARTLYATHVDQPSSSSSSLSGPGGPPEGGGGGSSATTLTDPFERISWCCKESNPDDTALLIAGGLAADAPQKGLTFLELGVTPVYATSSWQVLADHFGGRRQSLLATPAGAAVTDFCLVPRASPHFAGAQDPVAVLALLSSGEMITLSFPSGYPISPTNMLPPSITLVHPFVTRFGLATLDRERWLGMVERREAGEPLLRGGAAAVRPRRRYEGRNIVLAAHADGTVRLWDAGHADDMENASSLQVDVARALGRAGDGADDAEATTSTAGGGVDITTLALASATGEFAAGTATGEVVVYRWDTNRYFGRRTTADPPEPPNPGGLTDISARAEPSLREGLQPFVLYEMPSAGAVVTAVQVSDVGFVAAASEAGDLAIVDLRGPAVIFQASVADFAKAEKRSSLIGGGSRHHHSSSGSSAPREWAVTIEFGVMTLEGDSYSSIACFVGTNLGKVITLKLLPSGPGYAVKVAGVVDLKDRIVAICPIVADKGCPAAATGSIVAGLRNGQQVNGTLVVVTQSEIRIFKPATAKGASKSFDSALCDAAAVTEFELHGFAVVGVFGDGTARAYSLPGLKEINRAPVGALDPSRSTNVMVARTGDVVGWAGPSELVVIPVWGKGKGLDTTDVMINDELEVPPRPTISNLQWISGTQYVSPTDLDLLIGGPDRPASKRMMAAAAQEARQARAGSGGSGSNPRAGTSQEGWGEYLTRQLNERTEKLNIMGDNMDNLQQSSQGWAEDVNKYISKQKRNLFLGALKPKLG